MDRGNIEDIANKKEKGGKVIPIWESDVKKKGEMYIEKILQLILKM